ncbi:helix-turn-helix domain-containing protein [Mycobacterium barrassiae]|uniref:helix-turn-helix domain-containing protein n=1 Tax=Mycobacterium barrassiae TaxID=319709 RepID=UPI00226580C8|nr:AraC family transcriptional regulator [Mycobacterium barrassiae]
MPRSQAMVATKSPAGIRYAFALARDAGVPCERLLAGTRWTETGVVAAGHRIEQDDEFVITANLVRELGDPVTAGISVGSKFTVGDLGIWGYALLSSADAGEALTVALAYATLSPTVFNPQPVAEGDVATVVLRYEHLPVDVREYYAARDLSALPLLLRMSGLAAGPLSVDVPFDAERGMRLREALHPFTLETGAAQYRIRIPSEALKPQLPTADPVTRAACARECERLVHTRDSAPTLSATVRSRFAQSPEAMPSVEELAAELHMSTRTLRRQLNHEHTSYRELRNDVSHTLAVELLSVVGLSVNEVARRLGYGDATAFSHAFRRWTGKPASDFRSSAQYRSESLTTRTRAFG